MAFSTTEPLSEIVWSPNKGLSLNCVDSSFADENISLYRDVEPSSMVLALLQSVTGGISTTDGPVDDVFVKPIAKSDISSSASPTIHPTSDSDSIIQDFEAHEEHDTGKTTSRGSYRSSEMQGLFSIGKKRCSFQQQLLVGSKRVKNQIQETPHSKSYVQQESSFMNLISNMMKGFSQSTKMKGTKSVKLNRSGDDTLLTLYHLCDSVHLSRACQPDQKLITCHKNQDPEPQNTGSKSNFLSTYSQALKNVGTRKSHLVAEASEDFELSNEVDGIDVTPITCYAENSSLYKQYFQSHKFQVSTPRYDAGPSLQPKIRPRKFLNSHENRGNDSVECRNCYHLGLSKEKGVALHSSSTRHNKNNNENVECYALSQRKETNNIFLKSDNLEGLWISRFFPKSTPPLMICDHLNEIGGSQHHSTDFSMLPHSHKNITNLHNCKIEETREQSSDDLLLTEAKKLQNCINNEASTGFKDDKGKDDHTSKHNFNTVTPFPGLRDSEAMASMFARRLGAIRYMPTNRTDIIPHRKTSSMAVHHLRSWC